MADTRRGYLELQRLLRAYLEHHPEKRRELADEFRVAVGTIRRWANGYSRPTPQVEKTVIASLKNKIHQELMSVLDSSLIYNLESELAREFEISISTVKRWVNGTSRPHPRFALMVIAYIRNKIAGIFSGV